MSQLQPAEAKQLGQLLYAEGFQPLPDVNDDGHLIGTILWRLRDGYVEYLALRTDGFALAMRAEAKFTYRTPHLHGPVTEHRTGHGLNALDWLLDSTGGSDPSPRTRLPPRPPGQHRRSDDDGGGWR